MGIGGALARRPKQAEKIEKIRDNKFRQLQIRSIK